jgi:hypothetical protein
LPLTMPSSIPGSAYGPGGGPGSITAGSWPSYTRTPAAASTPRLPTGAPATNPISISGWNT